MADDHRARLEAMFRVAPVNAFYESSVLEVGDASAGIEMPAHPALFHGGGGLHGSAIFKMLDDAAAFAVYSLEHEFVVATNSFTVNFLRPVTGGVLEATGRVVDRTRSAYLAESSLRCDGALVASGSGVFRRTSVVLLDVPGYGD